MGIFGRLNQVIKSNLNSMLDTAEDPEKLISQTIIEMEAEVKRAKRELITTLGASKRIDKEKEETQAEVAVWEDRAVLALRNGDDALAREALKQKARLTKKAGEAAARASQNLAAADEMRDTLERVERQIEDLKARKATLAQQVRRARTVPGDAVGGLGSSGTFSELERMSGRIAQLDAEVEAHGVLEDPARLEVDAKFRRLERTGGDGAIEDELEALKARLRE